MLSLESAGKITVAVAGTPVQVTSKKRLVAKVHIQAWPANTGKVWIGLEGMNKTTGAKVLAVLSAPAAGAMSSFTIQTDMHPQSIDLSKIHIDVDTNGEAALVSFIV